MFLFVLDEILYCRNLQVLDLRHNKFKEVRASGHFPLFGRLFSSATIFILVLFLEFPTNTPRVFHVGTTWKRPFTRRFNVEYTWCVCGVPGKFLFSNWIQTLIH